EGVSQQPQTLRSPAEAQEIINALLDPVEGLQKRPPTNYAADITEAFGLSDALSTNACFSHAYVRDLTEKYLVVAINGDLKVFSLADSDIGTERTVTFPDGKGYLAASTPGQSFRAITVGDYTFLVNREVTVAQGSTHSDADIPQALVWVKQADFSVN